VIDFDDILDMMMGMIHFRRRRRRRRYHYHHQFDYYFSTMMMVEYLLLIVLVVSILVQLWLISMEGSTENRHYS
jgi:hypothetical protein